MGLDDKTKPADSVHVNHYCCIEGCGKWGGLGFASSKAVDTQWWCSEHYPHGDAMKDRDSTFAGRG
ncbi:hypothetical protein ASC90_21720 [Rhizobium sp. Root1220]|nr:hypothetical protein ASC90_21720 [Rhizobium sp. Root1220]